MDYHLRCLRCRETERNSCEREEGKGSRIQLSYGRVLSLLLAARVRLKNFEIGDKDRKRVRERRVKRMKRNSSD